MWLVCEPIHAVTYFAPESFAAWEEAGLRGFWRGYFATRAAPFGPVGPAVPIATFFNFAPSMVERALPSVWELCPPERALEARARGAADSLQAVDAPAADAVARSGIAGQLQAVIEALPVAGRALFAANVALPWPDEPLAAVWHALTLLREHRGDGHNAALTSAGIDGCAAHVLAGAAGGAQRSTTQPARGWTDDEWEAAIDRLAAWGLVDADGRGTDAGRQLHAALEATTDVTALEPWKLLGPDATAAVERALRPLAEAVVTSGLIRFPNPMGLPPLTGDGHAAD